MLCVIPPLLSVHGDGNGHRHVDFLNAVHGTDSHINQHRVHAIPWFYCYILGGKIPYAVVCHHLIQVAYNPALEQISAYLVIIYLTNKVVGKMLVHIIAISIHAPARGATGFPA